MGVYSTSTLSRSETLELIRSYLDESTNEELANALFALRCVHTLSNYTVLNDDNPLLKEQQ